MRNKAICILRRVHERWVDWYNSIRSGRFIDTERRWVIPNQPWPPCVCPVGQWSVHRQAAAKDDFIWLNIVSLGAAWCSKSPTVPVIEIFPWQSHVLGKHPLFRLFPKSAVVCGKCAPRAARPCTRRDAYPSPAARPARPECTVLWPLIITLYIDWRHS